MVFICLGGTPNCVLCAQGSLLDGTRVGLSGVPGMKSGSLLYQTIASLIALSLQPPHVRLIQRIPVEYFTEFLEFLLYFLGPQPGFSTHFCLLLCHLSCPSPGKTRRAVESQRLQEGLSNSRQSSQKYEIPLEPLFTAINPTLSFPSLYFFSDGVEWFYTVLKGSSWLCAKK